MTEVLLRDMETGRLFYMPIEEFAKLLKEQGLLKDPKEEPTQTQSEKQKDTAEENGVLSNG